MIDDNDADGELVMLRMLASESHRPTSAVARGGWIGVTVENTHTTRTLARTAHLGGGEGSGVCRLRPVVWVGSGHVPAHMATCLGPWHVRLCCASAVFIVELIHE